MRAAPGRPPRKARLARALGLDGNPLRRGSDRAEAWIRAWLVVIFLIAGPMAALAAGQWTAHAAVPAALITLAVTALALLGVLRLIQRFLNWRRAAAWEAAWRVVGPRWTGRRH